MNAFRDQGSVAIVSVGIIAVVVSIGVAIATAGAVQIASARAQSAADLAALAGAYVSRDARALGTATDPCETARAVAFDNGAHEVECDVDARGAVTVHVSVSFALGNVLRSARAGTH